jgi:5-methylcytosine-specific restriction endonuclease McrA
MPALDPITGIKRCAKKDCEETDPREFSKNRNTSDGLMAYCKPCNSARTLKWQKDNPEKHRAKGTQWAKDNPEKGAKWAKDNPEKRRAIEKKYKKANADKISASHAKYRKANPEKVNAYGQRRRARKADLPLLWSDKHWQECLDHFGHRCAYCGRGDVDLHQDHVIPIDDSRLSDEFKGMGGTVPWNMVPACPPCNISKSNRDPFEHIEFGPLWLHLLGRIIQQPSI